MTIVGNDGISPIYDPEGAWRIWSINEIWQGADGANESGTRKFVPKINDYVIDPAIYQMYIVDYIDEVTLVPTIRQIRPYNMSSDFSETDILFGVGPGTQADTYRAYVDKSVTPHVLAVDIRLRVGGNAARYAKIFRGSNLQTEQEVISRIYDGSGNFISENVPLELVAIDSHVNYSIQTVAVCHTVADLNNGELVIVVIYGDQGHVVSKRQLLVENTSFIRDVNSSQKYISHINLESPFLVDDSTIIEFPLNIPTNALNAMGVVNYSDGSTLKLPANGTKFALLGLEQFSSTIIGQELDLILRYTMASNEVGYSTVGTPDQYYVTEPYKLRIVDANNSYTVKLFGYPVWINDDNGYTIEWWLYNLDRNIFYNVTPFITFNTNTGAFNPKGYGYLQRKTVSINLRDVSGAFKPFIHVQSIDITLYGSPANNVTPWTVSHATDDSRPNYGIELKASRVSNQILNISSDISTYEEWKERIYDRIYPLIDRATQLTVPSPTHLVVTYEGVNREIAIENWNQNIDFSTDITVYKSVKIRFIKRVISGDMHLGIAYLTIKSI